MQDVSYLKYSDTVYKKFINALSLFKNLWNMNRTGGLELSAALVSKIDECYKTYYNKNKNFNEELKEFLQDPFYRKKLSLDMHKRKLCSCVS